MTDPSDPSEPRQPPRPPQFTPPPPDPTAPYTPLESTSPFPPVAYEPVNYAPPGYAPAPGYAPDYSQAGHPPPAPPYPGAPDHYGPPPPRKSKAPLIALIVAISLLLCGGVVTSGVLIVRSITDKAKEVAAPIVNPTFPEPELPGLPTDLPTFPTDLPGLPGADQNKEISVTYEVTGDGPAEILYTEQLGTAPKTVTGVKLPWKVTTTMKGVSFVSVSARRTDGDSGDITCRATVDGKEVAKQTGSGPYATTTCNQLVFD